MSADAAAPDLGRLKRLFLALLAFEATAGILALAFAALYFGAHVAWCLGAFAGVVASAVLAQIAFIAAFGRGPRKGA
jgi:hypothetical protein